MFKVLWIQFGWMIVTFLIDLKRTKTSEIRLFISYKVNAIKCQWEWGVFKEKNKLLIE